MDSRSPKPASSQDSTQAGAAPMRSPLDFLPKLLVVVGVALFAIIVLAVNVDGLPSDRRYSEWSLHAISLLPVVIILAGVGMLFSVIILAGVGMLFSLSFLVTLMILLNSSEHSRLRRDSRADQLLDCGIKAARSFFVLLMISLLILLFLPLTAAAAEPWILLFIVVLSINIAHSIYRGVRSVTAMTSMLRRWTAEDAARERLPGRISLNEVGVEQQSDS